VANWAQTLPGVDEEDANILRTQKINGAALFELTKEELIAPPYKMAGGAAINLMKAIEKLKGKGTRCLLL